MIRTVSQAKVYIALLFFSSAYCEAVPETGNASADTASLVMQRFLANVRANGAGLICKKNEVEQQLQITIPKVKERKRGDELAEPNATIFRFESNIEPINANSPVISGAYSLFKSSTHSICSITVSIKPKAFCNFRTDSYRHAVGLPIPYQAPHSNPRTDLWDTYSHTFGQTESVDPVEIWLKIPKYEECVRSVTVNAPGKWHIEQ